METVEEKNTESPIERASIWKLGGLTWRELGRGVWLEMYQGTLLTHAAALSFYFLLAIFPLLLFLITILGFFAESGIEMRAKLLVNLSQLLPYSASQLIYTTVDEIAENADGAKLSFGILTALWIVSSGMGAITEALNAMYGVREARPFWRVRLSAVVLTLALAVLILSALLLLLYGGEIGEQIAVYFNQSSRYAAFWVIAQVPVVLAFVLFAFALIYYFSPNVLDQKWYWITPGSIVGVILWLLVSVLFRFYLRHFDTYSVTYGSLGAVIILMLWFYLTGVAILIGGKINAEIENAAAEAGAPDAKLHGEKIAEE
ncbi:MAG TPA: YihY/virulence factor BrkB family protein [Pyrinomonadaceae bacterium]|nr:YihY/virulence factor BrkB family protein [Pyrinomonadaceae bacterium]